MSIRTLACALALVSGCQPRFHYCPDGSYLNQPAFCLDDVVRPPAVPYQPQPGDILLSTDPLWIARIGHRAALSGPPHHSGIVFARPDGLPPAILESGPHNTLRVRITEAVEAMASYEQIGLVFVRRRSAPLTEEQSALLTRFALAQDGKRFASVRVAAQVTPLRSRGPLRTEFMGGPHGERDSYFCSELVLEACLAAGLLDPARTRPAATYPRDLFFGDSPNRFLHQNLQINDFWEPPARWASRPVPATSGIGDHSDHFGDFRP
jgi:hypothetical protein